MTTTPGPVGPTAPPPAEPPACGQTWIDIDGETHRCVAPAGRHSSGHRDAAGNVWSQTRWPVSTTPGAPPPAQPPERKYVVDFGYLCEVVAHCTCGTGTGGHYGAHEQGCGLEPVAPLDELLGMWERDREALTDAVVKQVRLSEALRAMARQSVGLRRDARDSLSMRRAAEIEVSELRADRDQYCAEQDELHAERNQARADLAERDRDLADARAALEELREALRGSPLLAEAERHRSLTYYEIRALLGLEGMQPTGLAGTEES